MMLNEPVMSNMSDDERRQAFKELHKPERPIYQIGHARRGNKSEDYSSTDIRSAATRLLDASMKTAHGVIAGFAKHAKK